MSNRIKKKYHLFCQSWLLNPNHIYFLYFLNTSFFFSYERVLATNLWCMYENFWSKYDFFHELNQYEFSNYWSSSFPVTFFPHALWGQFSAFFIKWSTQCCVWKCSRMWLHQSNFYIISKSCLENHQCSSALYVKKRLVFVMNL